MSKTRDNYRVVGNTVPELVLSLNFLLQRIADRIDRMEGIRGTPSIEADLTMNENVITDVGGGALMDDAARLDDLADFPKTTENETITGQWTFSQNTAFQQNVGIDGDLEVLGDLTVQDDAVLVYDSAGTLIHSLGI